ncbi:MAG: UDP-glucose--hexose-1-phosphate uridylyltransferase [Oscillospiraceae bacterium]|jgi:UDPglucose--hexose-1-phosphate uridylyltransferase|nr:UDP-glucose--hexose-1-phosphate uridylyltransferase [Oscillospiraceae bacterium]
MTAAHALSALLAFAQAHGLLAPEDRPWARNLLLDALSYAAPPQPEDAAFASPLPQTAAPLLAALCDDAAARGAIADSPARRELLSARLMGILTPPPSAVAQGFTRIARAKGVQAATDWFYSLCRANNYIQVDAIARNVRFFAPSDYGALEITINLSKPEKDPRDIAALLGAPSVGYPKCMLCVENEGYAGRLDYPARQTLRMLPISLCGQAFHLQYSPYLYYPEHCIVLRDAHQPMAIGPHTFAQLLDFLWQFPHYFIGSNADLPIVGGSILNHDHFQGGRHTFSMQQAPAYARTRHPDASNVDVTLVRWPMTTLRLQSGDARALCALAERVLACWRGYSDESADVLAESGGTPHNTITPIARRHGDTFTLDLVLRNNRATPAHPLGLFHPHADLHHIKKENIGLIEVMGLFILPGRLVGELDALANYLTGARAMTPPQNDEALAQHWPWLQALAQTHGTQNSPGRAQEILRQGLASVCARVLADAGVFKLDTAGKAAMARFLAAAGFAPPKAADGDQSQSSSPISSM